jgi:hypothetical protein
MQSGTAIGRAAGGLCQGFHVDLFGEALFYLPQGGVQVFNPIHLMRSLQLILLGKAGTVLSFSARWGERSP